LHPSVELEVITKEVYPQKNGSHVTVQCKATAPGVNSKIHNPILLNPSIISFYFHKKHVPVNNCRPSSGSTQKICELIIPKFGEKDAGKYYCMARNGFRCTTIGIDIPSHPYQ
ncbi:---NA---, partial [Paramuricea clavata]